VSHELSAISFQIPKTTSPAQKRLAKAGGIERQYVNEFKNANKNIPQITLLRFFLFTLILITI